MRKFIITVAVALMALAGHAEGISTAEQLAAFAEAANAGGDLSQWQDDRGTIRLTADIDLGKIKKMKPIARFEGVFDGQGHAIRNWKATSGLFGLIAEGAVVRNLTIDASCSMRASDDDSEEFYAGFIADANYGTIERCTNRGSINHRSSRSAANTWVGGVCGQNKYIVTHCKNTGAIVSTGNGSATDPEITISVGGVLGGSHPKSLPGAFTAYCENEGAVSYSGAFPTSYIGGIAGYNFYVKLKFCINRGEVSAAPVTGITPAAATSVLAGGICGMAKGDVVCCDNYGEISSRRDMATMIGGICGAAHTAMTVGDCANFGKVSASGTRGASVGGVVGQSTRSVVIVQCRNTASVRFTGESVDLLSAVGGIAGCVYAKKDAQYAASIRDCRNEGAVFCASGANTRNSYRGMHTGGICGYFAGNQAVRGDIRDCVNTGEVRSESGRAGGITALASYAEVDSCENRGPVVGAGAVLGGIAAVAGNGIVKGCVNRAEITSDGKGIASGITGLTHADGPAVIRDCRNGGVVRGAFGLTAAILAAGTNAADRVESCGVGGAVGTPAQSLAAAPKVTGDNFGQFITGRNVEKNKAEVSRELPCYYWDGK